MENQQQPAHKQQYEVGSRKYKFLFKKNEDPNDNEVEEVWVDEADLTKDHMNYLFQDLVSLFKYMPVDVQAGFVQYVDYTLAQEQKVFEMGQSLAAAQEAADQMQGKKIITTPGGFPMPKL